MRLLLPAENTRSTPVSTPLVRKLGIRPGWRLLVLNASQDYRTLVSDLPQDCELVTADDPRPVEFIHYFVRSREDLEQTLQTLRQRIVPHGTIWVSWPKKSSGVRTDLDENLIRELALQTRLVDDKVADIDPVWSGLKLVIRLLDR
jgi:hypothetical protein